MNPPEPQSFDCLTDAQLRHVRYVLTDIDDTLTTDGALTAQAYASLNALTDAGIKVIPITGRPAGWCDMIARFWPVDAVVGENGAFYMYMDRLKESTSKKLVLKTVSSPEVFAQQRARLQVIGEQILQAVPGCALASDQAYRLADLAIDFCEDVPSLGLSGAQQIKGLMEQAGLTAKISSIHVNGWFGAHDKLSTTRLLLRQRYSLDLDQVNEQVNEQVLFVGDSPNDSPMFGAVALSVAVANARPLLHLMSAPPRYITASRGGAGFSEVAQRLVNL
jgi:HAD superfamily hydrolase (TIGR01484 family)